MSDEVEIRFPVKVPEELKVSKGLSDAMKLQLAEKIKDGLVRFQTEEIKRHYIEDMDAKINMILDIMQDRSKFDKWVTIDEISEISEMEASITLLQRLSKAARDKELKMKKFKKNGVTCYKIT